MGGVCVLPAVTCLRHQCWLCDRQHGRRSQGLEERVREGSQKEGGLRSVGQSASLLGPMVCAFLTLDIGPRPCPSLPQAGGCLVAASRRSCWELLWAQTTQRAQTPAWGQRRATKINRLQLTSLSRNYMLLREARQTVPPGAGDSHTRTSAGTQQ